MQQPPTAAELLATVMEVLGDEVVPSLTGPVQHHAAWRRTSSRSWSASCVSGATPHHGNTTRSPPCSTTSATAPRRDLDLATLRGQLASELRRGMADDEATDERVWHTLMAVVRDDLTIAKPGHDAWDGD